MANTLLCYLQLCFSESVDCLANSIPLRGIRKYAELYSIWPKERFVALQSSRGRVGTPPQKPRLELCCRRLGLNSR